MQLEVARQARHRALGRPAGRVGGRAGPPTSRRRRCGMRSMSSRSCVAISSVTPTSLKRANSCMISNDSSRIEVAGRLVGDQHVGPRRDGARDADALLLARRQRDRRMRSRGRAVRLGRAPRARASRSRGGSRPRSRAAARRCRRRCGRRAACGPGTRRRAAAGSAGSRRRGMRAGVLIVHEHAAARRPLDQRDQPEQRALARARRAPSRTRARRARC